MAFWIFKCSPEKYRLRDRLADPNPTILWKVSRYQGEMRAGDTVFVWETGKERGIRAVFRIDEPPREATELPSEQPYNVRPSVGVVWRTQGTLVDRDVDLPHTVLREIPELRNLSVLRKDVFQQATNFSVTDEEGKVLLQLIRKKHR